MQSSSNIVPLITEQELFLNRWFCATYSLKIVFFQFLFLSFSPLTSGKKDKNGRPMGNILATTRGAFIEIDKSSNWIEPDYKCPKVWNILEEGRWRESHSFGTISASLLPTSKASEQLGIWTQMKKWGPGPNMILSLKGKSTSMENSTSTWPPSFWMRYW